MNARRLDLSQRQFLKRALREQLGDFEYQRLVDQLGEDGLIDAALAHAEPAKQRRGARVAPLVEALGWPVTVLEMLLGVLGRFGTGWVVLALGTVGAICLIDRSREDRLIDAAPMQTRASPFVEALTWPKSVLEGLSFGLIGTWGCIGLTLGIPIAIANIAASEGVLLLALPVAYVAGVIWCGVLVPTWRALTRL